MRMTTVAELRELVGGFAGEHAERVTVIGPVRCRIRCMPFAARCGTGRGALRPAVPGRRTGGGCVGRNRTGGGLHRAADFLYADEACVSPASREREPFFKPDFSPDLLLSTNYIGRPWFAAAALLRRVAVTPRALLRDGEYDLVLRCTEQAAAVHHVPKLLAAARAGRARRRCHEPGRAGRRRGAPRHRCRGDGRLPAGHLAVPAHCRQPTGKVAIIIPTCAAHGYIENCIDTLRDRTAYRNYEIVCIDNIPDSQMAWKVWLQQNADRIVDIPEAFNWSRFNNLAAAATDSEYLLFLNDDIEITQDDWLDVLLEHAQRPEVGVVGPQLLYPSGKVQHAGMFLGAGIGRHAFRFASADEPGYFGLALTQRNVIAVTGACMLMRRDVLRGDSAGSTRRIRSSTTTSISACARTRPAS